jgi:hypothetical protein
VLVAAAALVAHGAAGAQSVPCRAAKRGSVTSRISLEAAAVHRRDTVRTIRVCLNPARDVTVGSFHLIVEYDSTLVRAVRFSQGPSGTMVANLTKPGRADIAGADPSGFTVGELLGVEFAEARRATRATGAFTLRVLELTATSGASLLGQVAVAGIGVPRTATEPAAEPLTPKSAETPHIDSLVPGHAKVAGPGGLIAVTIHGSGFHSDGNEVLFAGVQIAQLTSGDGTSLHLVLPSALPATGEVPPRMIGAGTYEIRIRTSAGTSNPIAFILERPQ